jgi:hypothetical protein
MMHASGLGNNIYWALWWCNPHITFSVKIVQWFREVNKSNGYISLYNVGDGLKMTRRH